MEEKNSFPDLIYLKINEKAFYDYGYHLSLRALYKVENEIKKISTESYLREWIKKYNTEDGPSPYKEGLKYEVQIQFENIPYPFHINIEVDTIHLRINRKLGKRITIIYPRDVFTKLNDYEKPMMKIIVDHNLSKEKKIACFVLSLYSEKDPLLLEQIIKGENDEDQFIRSLYEEQGEKKKLKIKNLFFKDQDLLSNRIDIALNNGNHIILIGPPGTGKSKLAKEICEVYKGKENYIMSTATSDWSTFDTIGGYRLNKENKLEFFPGIFLQCFKDKSGSDINKWLIIDEINRADIDKAFGSLFSSLSGDNITLHYEINGKVIELITNPEENEEKAENKFIIPKDWHIIATMNTFDKSSLYEMSYAFMRRFAFVPIEVPLDSEITGELIKEYVNCWNLEFNNEIAKKLSILWPLINKYRKIGPAIIEDIYRYVIESKTQDYTSALIMYVLPQFEGLSEDTLKQFVKEIGDNSFEFIKKDDVANFIVDFFCLTEKDFLKSNKDETNNQKTIEDNKDLEEIT